MSQPLRASLPGRVYALAGGLLFAASLGYFVYAYAGFGRPAGAWTTEAWPAVIWNILIFSIFALHHSLFARSGLKSAVRARVSPALERATYVWIASVLFVLTLWAWSPVPGIAWHATGVLAWLLELACVAGVILTGVAAAALDPLELAGVRQAFGQAPRAGTALRARKEITGVILGAEAPDPARREEGEYPVYSTDEQRRRAGCIGSQNASVISLRALSTTGVYGLVRHPIYLGWVLMVWCLPLMTGTRVVFAAISSVYLVVAIPFEERDMRRTMGRAYDAYAHVVRWRMIPWVY